MSGRTFVVSLTVLCSSGVDLSPAGDRAGSEDVVVRALNAERDGTGDRRAVLEPAIAADPDEDRARWQAGYVSTRKGWRTFDDVPRDDVTTERLRAYEIQRSLAKETAQSQLELANWCRRNELPDRERAHLTAVVMTLGDRTPTEIRRRLGQQPVAGAWRSEAEVERLRNESSVFQHDLRTWRGRIAAVHRGLSSSSTRAARTARERLHAIDDPAVVPALHAALGATTDSYVAGELLEAVARFDTVLATRVLALHAAFSPWESLRRTATNRLARRNPRQWVPLLLGLTRSPYRIRYETLNGALPTALAWQVVEREGMRTREVDVLATGRRVHDVTLPRRGPRTINDFARLDAQRLMLDSARRAERERGERERGVELSNEFAALVNDRVVAVVAGAANRKFDGGVDEVWAWWQRFVDVEPIESDAKVLTIRVNVAIHDEIRLWRPGASSCLVAGTPVWTDAGPTSIEEIRVGDRVLAKDPETGRLEFRPVLHRTTRPPRPVVTFDLDDESITATRGHAFWVSGRGWVPARDLRRGDRLHDARGTTTVTTAPRLGNPEPTFNLVVADHHTYFVGRAAILSHDVTPERPTDRRVPGLK